MFWFPSRCVSLASFKSSLPSPRQTQKPSDCGLSSGGNIGPDINDRCGQCLNNFLSAASRWRPAGGSLGVAMRRSLFCVVRFFFSVRLKKPSALRNQRDVRRLNQGSRYSKHFSCLLWGTFRVSWREQKTARRFYEASGWRGGWVQWVDDILISR